MNPVIKKNRIQKWLNTILVGWFLAKRQIKGSNRSTTMLIIFIMTLTFLNLVVVSGILIGLIEGGNRANREQYTGDVIITTIAGEPDIGHTHELVSTLGEMQGVSKISVRYLEPVTIEANYKTRRDFSVLRDTAGTQIVGLTLADEEAMSKISNFVVEGDFLNENESGYILIGANLLHRYSADFGDFFASLEGVYPGDEVKVTVGDNTRTFIVKGILDTKVDQVSLRAFVTEADFWRLVDRPGLNANEFSIRLDPNSSVTPDSVKANLVAAGFNDKGKIQTATEAIPEFL